MDPVSTTRKSDSFDNPKILIADDVSVMRHLLAAVLRPMGFSSFDFAANGIEALEKFRTKQHDLVFLDVDMPQMTGLQALQAIKDINPDAFVIMVSGHSDADILASALSLGANGYVVKDYKSGSVAGMIKKFREHFTNR